MSGRVPIDLRRALLYIAAAAGLGVVIGILQQGSIGGGLALGLAVGVTIGLALFETASRYLSISKKGSIETFFTPCGFG